MSGELVPCSVALWHFVFGFWVWSLGSLVVCSFFFLSEYPYLAVFRTERKGKEKKGGKGAAVIDHSLTPE